jgi:hypothetical protein
MILQHIIWWTIMQYPLKSATLACSSLQGNSLILFLFYIFPRSISYTGTLPLDIFALFLPNSCLTKGNSLWYFLLCFFLHPCITKKNSLWYALNSFFPNPCLTQGNFFWYNCFMLCYFLGIYLILTLTSNMSLHDCCKTEICLMRHFS